MKKFKNKTRRLAEAQEFCDMFGLPEPLARFNQNRHGAATRGIEWRLTFDEWWELWKPHYHLRGSGPGKMNLCREADQGGYEVGNVRIDTFSANMQENGKIIHLAAKARHASNQTANRAARFHKHYGYIRHILPLPLELMDPVRVLIARQELESVMSEISPVDSGALELRKVEALERIAAARERVATSLERQRHLRESQKKSK